MLVRDDRFASPGFGMNGFGMNGIVWHPRGFLLSVRYDTGTLFRIELRDARVSEVRLDEPLVGGDGAESPYGVYSLAGRLDMLLAGQTADTFVLRQPWRRTGISR